MKQFVPVEKLSKSRQREIHKKKRRSWGAISPITRRSPNPKAYKRKKVHGGDAEEQSQSGFFVRTANQRNQEPLAR
ncbi:MAG: hypothetical protein ACYC5K_08375 [Saccharofermentanales bacterium]